MQPQRAREILSRVTPVQGWFSVEAAMLFALIDDVQQREGIDGDLFEIGCHHGRSAVFLAAMAAPGRQRLAVCDLFGAQDANASQSGSGDLDVFERNMQPARDAGVEITLFQQRSDTLDVESIGRGYRFFHIDGGHNCDEALADLELAAQVIEPRGVIVLDDPFRVEWPGVTEALLRFLDRHAGLRAVMVGFNKLVIARVEHAETYRAAIADKQRLERYGLGYPWYLKSLPFHDQPLQIFYVPTYVAADRWGLWVHRVARANPWLDSPLVRPLKGVAKRLLRTAR